MTKFVPDPTGVPETMLGTLHNRAGEAKRPNGIFRDPDTVRSYDAIDDDFERHFGRPESSHAVRAVEPPADDAIRVDGVIVSLGESSETQIGRAGCRLICPKRSGSGSAFSRRQIGSVTLR